MYNYNLKYYIINYHKKHFLFSKLEKENEELKNELKIHKRQKEMIVQLKVELVQSKERVLNLQSQCDSKIATYLDQIDKLKNQFNEKVSIKSRYNKLKKNLYFMIELIIIQIVG